MTLRLGLLLHKAQVTTNKAPDVNISRKNKIFTSQIFLFSTVLYHFVKMSKWDKAPNEILDQILDKVRHVGNNHRKSVNKQWFNIFLSTNCKYISIKLDPSEAI